MRRSTNSTIAVIESAYRVEGNPGSWFNGILSRIAAALGSSPLGVAALFDATLPEWVDISSPVNLGLAPSFLAEAFNQPIPAPANARALVDLYRSGFFGSAVDFVFPIIPAYSDLFERYAIRDVAVLITADPTHRGCLFALSTARRSYSARERYLWRKIATHISAGLRLRQNLSELLEKHGDPLTRADAILSESGKLEHAVGTARGEHGRVALREALERISAARATSADEHPELAIDLWRGLVAGRWSLTEHFERGGRRYFVAYRNEPEIARHRKLTAREQQVFAYEAMGYSNKLIAYSLGLSPPTVVEYLKRARRKIGAGLSTTRTLFVASGVDEPSSDAQASTNNRHRHQR